MTAKTEAVIGLVASVLDLSPADVVPEASMETISAWDSLAQLNICLEFEQRFGVTMDMDTIAHATSVPALVALLDS